MTAVAPTGSPPADALADGGLPRRFGPYTLFAPVGRGGMAELFLARVETELGATRRAVVKLILPAFADDPRFAEMLVREAKLAAQLSHKHIVQVLDLGRDEGRLYIAMEYVEGFDLNALLRMCSDRGEGLPAEHALGIVADVLSALDYAHRRTTDSGDPAADGEARPLGLVHRDVSPSNILISYEGEVKLCDFGIAHANDVVRADANEALKGKAGYMSPEHARLEPIDARADLFAAGIILWELLAGRRLYRASEGATLLDRARAAEIPDLPDRGLPEHAELARIVRRALAPDRDDRYPTASAFERDLEAYLAKVGLLASRLRLGEWIATTFGTQLVEDRRASECRLPVSAPLRSPSAPARARAASLASVEVPRATRVPTDLAIPVPDEVSAPLLKGVSLSASPEPPLVMNALPASPDVDEPNARAAAPPAESDAELIAWANKRGVVSFLFFFSMAVVITAIWYFTRD